MRRDHLRKIVTPEDEQEAELKKIVETLYLTNHYETLLSRTKNRVELDEIYHDIKVFQRYGIRCKERWDRVRIWNVICDLQHATTVAYILHTLVYHDMDYLPLEQGKICSFKHPKNYFYTPRKEDKKHDSKYGQEPLDKTMEKYGGDLGSDSNEAL